MRSVTKLARSAAIVMALGSLAVPALADDGAEVAETSLELADDLKDVYDLNQHIKSWHAARDAGDKDAENAADMGLKSWLREEKDESMAQSLDARAEQRKAQAENKASKKVNVGGGKLGNAAKAAADDTADLAVELMTSKRLIDIRKELRVMQPKFTEGSAIEDEYSRKNKLLSELKRWAEFELANTGGELAEDAGKKKKKKNK